MAVTTKYTELPGGILLFEFGFTDALASVNHVDGVFGEALDVLSVEGLCGAGVHAFRMYDTAAPVINTTSPVETIQLTTANMSCNLGLDNIGQRFSSGLSVCFATSGDETVDTAPATTATVYVQAKAVR